MTKRHVDIDDNLLETVQAYLGTKTLKDTVNSALYEIAQYPAREAVINRWISDPYGDASELHAMGEAWQRDRDTWSTRARSSESISNPCTPTSSTYSGSETSPPVQ